MRLNGRENNQLREIKFTHNFTKHALGSVLVEFGDTKVIVTASVDYKKPKWMADDDERGWAEVDALWAAERADSEDGKLDKV